MTDRPFGCAIGPGRSFVGMGRASDATDADLIALLRKGTVEEDQALRTIYRTCYPVVSGFVLRNSGDADDARDVFQDGVLVLYRNITQGKFNGESALATYLFSICRFLWLKQLRRKGRMTLEAVVDAADFDAPLGSLMDQERRATVLALFDRLGEACKRLLLLSFYEELDMREIAERTGFKDEQNARNKKFKCLRALKELLAAEPATAQALRELRETDE
jgi:RNA polymerase sigma factor (sigma-70 family)